MADADRFARTKAWLADAERMAAIHTAIRDLDARTKPALRVIAGTERLASAQRIGVLAGSFNPPTLAHLALATSARQAAQLDAVLWSISRVTVDKEQVTRAPLAMRLATLAALTTPRPHEAVAISNRGLYLDQGGALRAAFPRLRELAFIVGFDKIVQIVDPRYYAARDAALDALFAQAELLVAPRAAEGAADLVALFARLENQRWATRVHFIPLDPSLRALSSSEIRQRIARGQAIAGLVPPEAAALVAAGGYAS